MIDNLPNKSSDNLDWPHALPAIATRHSDPSRHSPPRTTALHTLRTLRRGWGAVDSRRTWTRSGFSLVYLYFFFIDRCQRFLNIQNINRCVRLFTVLYFSLRSSRIESFALRATHLAWVSQLPRGRYFSRLPSLPRAIIPDARPLGTFENQDGRDGKTWYI